MKPNRALIALQIISIPALALGALLWAIDTAQINARITEQGLDPNFVGETDAGGRLVIWLYLMGFGLVAAIAWLVASSITFAIGQALERLAPVATTAAVIDAQERSRAAAVANGTLLDRVRSGLDEQ